MPRMLLVPKPWLPASALVVTGTPSLKAGATSQLFSTLMTHIVPERRTLSETRRRSGSPIPRTASMALSSAFPKSE